MRHIRILALLASSCYIQCVVVSSFPYQKTRNRLNSAAMSASRGAFILFEGVDRCGKTTQTALLSEYLASKGGVAKINFPDRASPVGKMINSYLTNATNMNDQAIHLLFSANRWEASEGIKAKLNAGTNVVCDRYAYSGVAFSSAKGMDTKWCKSCDKGLPAPDVIIYLDMPIEVSASRGNFGEERYENTDFQEIVRSKFMDLKINDGDKECLWQVIDAARTIDEIQTDVRNIALKTIREVGSTEIKMLWA